MSGNGAPTVVVGVDGSDRADRALDWSIEEAQLDETALATYERRVLVR
jgi:nucleotide-binding universal stress UspA family protein